MELSRLTNWGLLGEDHLETVERDAQGKIVPRSLHFYDDEGHVSLEQAYVRYVARSRILFVQSAVPLAIAAFIALAGVIFGWMMWNAPAEISNATELLLLDAVVAVGAICFVLRSLKLVVTLRMTLRDPDDWSTLRPIALNEQSLQRLRHLSGMPLTDDFDLLCTTTMRGLRRMQVALDANRKLREGQAAIANGRLQGVNGTHHGMSYNPADMSLVRMERTGVWGRLAVAVFYVPACAVPLGLLTLVSILFEISDSPTMTLLVFLAGLFFVVWGVLLPCMLVAVFACQWLLGTWLSGIGPFTPLDYRVRIQSRSGRWSTLVTTRHHAIAVEVYNQVARDIRQQPFG